MSDTPETVAEKLKMIPTILDMHAHYFVENHPGAYFDCLTCDSKNCDCGAEAQVGSHHALWCRALEDA